MTSVSRRAVKRSVKMLKWCFREKDDKVVLVLNGEEAVDLFNSKLGAISDIRPGRSATEILLNFSGRKNGKRVDRTNFDVTIGEKLNIDNATNTTFCKSARLLLGVTGETINTSKKRRLDTSSCSYETDLEDIVPKKYIGVRELPVSNLKKPPQHLMCREVKQEWVTVLKGRISKTALLQTVLPVMVDPDEVSSKEEFTEENLGRYNYITLGGNHLREALSATPDLPETMKYVHCHLYVGLNVEEAMMLGNQHNAKSKYLSLTFQDKVRQARTLKIQSDDNLSERLTKQLGVLEMKEIKKNSLSTILSVARYSEHSYKAASNCFEAYEAKFGVEKSFPQKIFRMLQGETDQTQLCVLQMAAERSPESAAMWYERECMRQQLQETFISHTHCSSWEDAQTKFPSHAAQVETLVGLSKTSAAERVNLIGQQAKKKESKLITVDIIVKEGNISMQGEEIDRIVEKYKHKIVQEVVKKSRNKAILHES